MKNETFTPERIKAEADAFFEWDGEDRSLVTTTSCLLFAQHIAGLMQARSAQPAPVVQEGYVLVPVEPTEAMWGGLARDLMMWLDFGNPTVEALRKHLSMLGREWPAWMDGESEMKGSGVPSKGTRATLIYKAMLAAAPAQGQQVECDTCHGQGEVFIGDVQSFGYMSMQPPEPIMEVCPECSGESVQRQHPDDAAVDRFAAAMKAKLAKSRAKGRGGWEDKAQCSAEYLSELLRGHVEKGDPVDVANFCMMLQQRGEGIAAPAQQVEWRTTAVMLEQANAGLAQLNGKLRAELSALKAQQVGQEPQRCQCCGYLVTESEHRGCLRAAAPQPAPSQDVAGSIVLSQEGAKILAEAIGAHAYVLGALVNGRPDLAMNEVKKWVDGFMDAGSSVTAHDKQSGEVKP